MRKRSKELDPVEAERQALVEQRIALEELRGELAERVASVQDRELELRAAIAQAGGSPLPAAQLRAAGQDDVALDQRRAALDRRERELASREADGSPDLERRMTQLDERERELERRERQLEAAPLPPIDPASARLGEIEARLGELRDAEQAFLRTQQELAGRSEAVAARERLVAQKERELDEREDGWGGATEMRELESRLRRLESQRVAAEQAQGFTGGFRKLADEGSRKRD